MAHPRARLPARRRRPAGADRRPRLARACLVAYTTPSPSRLGRPLTAPSLSLRPAEGGRLYLEAGEQNDRADLGTRAGQLAAMAADLLRRATAVLPGLAGAALAEHRVCVRPLPADGRSIAGRPAGVDGRYVVVTHSGVTLAAHLAVLGASEIVTGTDQPVLAPYRLGRFS